MVSIDKARNYIHANGTMWERALWDYLFDDGPLDRVHGCLLAYKNPDGGWGHGLEHDIKCPASNPLQLEFLLSILRDTGLPPGFLLVGTPEWVEAALREDGCLANPPELLDYPHAPWWAEGGQHLPDSITGNLIRFGACTPAIAESTRKWVEVNLTLEKIRGNQWLFMAYHGYDYFMNIQEYTDLETFRGAVIKNILYCVQAHIDAGEISKTNAIFSFAPTPDSAVAKAAPPGLMDGILDRLTESQREDGGWDDEHGLAYWQPYFSTQVLLALKNFIRL